MLRKRPLSLQANMHIIDYGLMKGLLRVKLCFYKGVASGKITAVSDGMRNTGEAYCFRDSTTYFRAERRSNYC